MKSKIKIKKNDFKMVIKIFAAHIKTVTQDINNVLKTC